MKNLLTLLREACAAAAVALGAVALFSAVFAPQIFAAHLAGMLGALQREGIDVKLKTPIGEASLVDRLQEEVGAVDEELLAARDRIAALETQLAMLDAPVEPTPAPGGSAGAECCEVGAGEGGGSGDPSPPAVAAPGDGVDPAESVEARPPGYAWAVVAGAEKSLSGQEAEIALLRRAGFSDVAILQSGDWYQSVVLFETRAAATAALDDVTKAVGAARKPYLRSLEVLCPQVEKRGVVWLCQ